MSTKELHPEVAALVEEYQSRLAASLEMLTGESVSINLLTDQEGSPDPDTVLQDPSAGWMWNRFELATSPSTWLATGATELASKAIGAKVLLAAGIEEMGDSEVGVSYGEVQQSAVSALAHWLSGPLGMDVAAGTATVLERTPPLEDCILLGTEVDGRALDPLCLVVPEALRNLLVHPQQSEPSECEHDQALVAPLTGAAGNPQHAASAEDPAIARILDFELPLRVSFGKAQLPLRDVLKLGTGSIIELDRSIGDPVEIIVNQRVVARGEVVVVEGNYGVSIRELTSGCS